MDSEICVLVSLCLSLKEIETERERDRQTDRQTETNRDRQTETNRQTD